MRNQIPFTATVGNFVVEQYDEPDRSRYRVKTSNDVGVSGLYETLSLAVEEAWRLAAHDDDRTRQSRRGG